MEFRSIKQVKECRKCTSEDLGFKYQPAPEVVVVTCNECGYSEWTQCADAETAPAAQ